MDFPHSVSPGDRLPTDAATWNAILGAAHAHRQPKRPAAPPAQFDPTGAAVVVWAFNDTGADLGAYKPAKVTAAGGVDVTGDGAHPWTDSPVLTVGTPGASTDIVAVTLEAIPDGEFGRVAVAGWCLCDVDVSDSSHKYASPTTDTDALVSGASGSIRIIPTGSGTARRCLVYLGDQIAGGAFTDPTEVVANGNWTSGPESITAASGVWTATLGIVPGLPLPSTASGTVYLVLFTIRASIGNAAASNLQMRLTMDGTVVNNSVRRLVDSPAGVTTTTNNITQSWILNPGSGLASGGAGMVQFEFMRTGAGAWTVTELRGDAAGVSSVQCLRLK